MAFWPTRAVDSDAWTGRKTEKEPVQDVIKRVDAPKSVRVEWSFSQDKLKEILIDYLRKTGEDVPEGAAQLHVNNPSQYQGGPPHVRFIVDEPIENYYRRIGPA